MCPCDRTFCWHTAKSCPGMPLNPLTYQNLAITIRNTRLNTRKFYMMLTLGYAFRTISQPTATFALHNLTRVVLYNRGRECLQRGTH